jgi:hypothetical protein
MLNNNEILVVVILVLIGLAFWSCPQKEGFLYESPEPNLGYPLYPKYDDYGRHIIPYKYETNAPYWQPPNRPRKLLGETSLSDLDKDDVLDHRRFW